jgi:hypothetical protein
MKARWFPVLLLVTCGAASAQTFRGGIQGTVTDSSGAALPGAGVTVKHVGTGLTRGAPADETASLPGFAPRAVKGVEVDASVSRGVDLVLAAGDLRECVEVTARAPLVDTTGNVQGGTIDGQQAAQLPLNCRDFTKVLSLVPGSAADPSGIYDSPGSFGLVSVNGDRAGRTTTSWTVPT